MYWDTIQRKKYASQSAIPNETHRNLAPHDDLVVDFALENTLKVYGFIPVVFEYGDEGDGWQDDGETCGGDVIYNVKNANSVGGAINRCRLSK